MSKFKALAGTVVLLGIPAGLGGIFAGVGYQFANQHVHDVTAVLQGANAIVRVSDYHHSNGGIVVAAGFLAVAWSLLTTAAVLLGGMMIARRNKSWD